jgi:hypothetical protein
MLETQEPLICRHLDEMCAADWTYRDVPFLQSMRVLIYMILWDEIFPKRHAQWRERLRLALWCVRDGLWLAWFRGAGEIASLRSASRSGGAYLVAVDHNNESLIQLLLEIVGALGADRTMLVTQDDNVHRRLSKEGAWNFRSQRLQQAIVLRPRHLGLANRVVRLPHVAGKSMLVKAQIWLAALRTAKLIDAYHDALNPSAIDGVITLCDSHNHEFVLAAVANAKGIKSATLQHGLVGRLHVPVVSRWIFAWGESSKLELVRLGVPEDKIVIAGRPGFDAALRAVAAEAGDPRSQLCDTYGIDSSQPVVSYFTTNLSPTLNRRLVDCFADAFSLALSGFVKLKSNASPRQIAEYREWLAARPETARIPVVTGESPWLCYAASDVVVTSHSTVGAEALAFGAVVVLLDLLPPERLRGMVPFYDDCIVVTSGAEFRDVMRRICEEPGYLDSLKATARQVSVRHLHHSADGDASKFIADFVRSAALC